MTKHTVSITRYKEKYESVKEAIRLSSAFGELEKIKGNAKVFIKPNIVVWTEKTVFPKWGVITTSRVIEDIVLVLKEMGIDTITIGEGITTLTPKNTEAPKHAYSTLGYEKLNQRYGVRFLNIFERPFEQVDIGNNTRLNMNSDILNADFVINVPVLKTHAQTVVSLGMKNLKGVLNIASRKKCHSIETVQDLDFMISQLPGLLPPSATIIDGIYTLEKGPSPDGKARRSNILIASADTLAADMVGARVLGYEPANVPYLVHAAKDTGRPTDLSDIDIQGEPIEAVESFHQYDFPYNEAGTLHVKMEKMGITGLSYKKYDNTMCTYCSIINGAILTAISFAWKGEPWDDIEVLTGKKMEPTPGIKKTILLGQCMCALHKDNPQINEMLPIKGCPPSPEETVKVFHQAGIPIEPGIFQNIEMGLGFFMRKYVDKPEFEESFFGIE
ncbi:MAG: DUF362 domain-containing protein [bacterium]|nr:DUF362 domain-containing protein [bacterium]